MVLALRWLLLPAAASGQVVEVGTAESHPTRADQVALENQPPDLGDVVERIISGTNVFRHQKGRPTLATNPQLTATVQDFATHGPYESV